MQNVTFARDWDHWTPQTTHAFKVGPATVTNEIAAAAAAAGVLEPPVAAAAPKPRRRAKKPAAAPAADTREEVDGGRPDQGNATGAADAAEG